MSPFSDKHIANFKGVIPRHLAWHSTDLQSWCSWIQVSATFKRFFCHCDPVILCFPAGILTKFMAYFICSLSKLFLRHSVFRNLGVDIHNEWKISQTKPGSVKVHKPGRKIPWKHYFNLPTSSRTYATPIYTLGCPDFLRTIFLCHSEYLSMGLWGWRHSDTW